MLTNFLQYSTEVPSTQGKLLPLPEEEFKKGLVQELSALDNFRVRILPVLGPLPCMFGQAAAAYIIAELAGNVHMRPLAVKWAVARCWDYASTDLDLQKPA